MSPSDGPKSPDTVMDWEAWFIDREVAYPDNSEGRGPALFPILKP